VLPVCLPITPPSLGPALLLSSPAKEWQVAHKSSKTDLPKEASPLGTVTFGYAIYFFFLPPIYISINKNYKNILN
jgi:hypothetical protein